MSIRGRVALLLVASAAGLTAHGVVDSEQLVRDLESCRDRAEAERVECYDRLVDALRADLAGEPAAPEASPQVVEAVAGAVVATEIMETTVPGDVEPDSSAVSSETTAEEVEPKRSDTGIAASEVEVTAAQPAPLAEPDPDQAESAAIAAEILFGRDDSEAKDMIEQAFGVEKLEAIEVQVLKVERSAYGKLILAMENGQIWMQLDSVRLSLRPGDGVRIKSAMSGSFLLEKQTGSRRIRVRRID